MSALELLIEKYEKAKQSQIELKADTPLNYAAQHQLLDQNIHLFEGLLNDLRALAYANASNSKLPLCGVRVMLPCHAVPHDIAKEFTDAKLKVARGMLSDDYKTGYREGITHFLEQKDN